MRIGLTPSSTSNDKDQIVSGSYDRTLKIWSLSTGNNIKNKEIKRKRSISNVLNTEDDDNEPDCKQMKVSENNKKNI